MNTTIEPLARATAWRVRGFPSRVILSCLSSEPHAMRDRTIMHHCVTPGMKE